MASNSNDPEFYKVLISKAQDAINMYTDAAGAAKRMAKKPAAKGPAQPKAKAAAS